MKRAVVFGIGQNYRNVKKQLEKEYKIVGYIDNNWKEKSEMDVHPVEYINTIDFDIIVILPTEYQDMYAQLIKYNIAPNQIVVYRFKHSILGYKYFGQHCDDLIIASIFMMIGIDKPSYLDLGAHDPFEISNTAFLYRQGCRGINVEANPYLIEDFKLIRPEDINLNIGVAVKEGILPFYKLNNRSGLNTFSKQEAKIHFGEQEAEVIELPVITLKKVIDEYCNGIFPDFLDCDIEGLDYEVLDDYDLQNNGSKVICVEVRVNMIEKFDNMLDRKGYFKFCRIGTNNIYVKKKYREKLWRY